MAIFANFVGVHRHSDVNIRDLPGAERDAVALWALFCDAIPGLEASSRLLINHDATYANVRQVMTDSLTQAGAEDTVIFTFSGHGSKDHRFAFHDTELGHLADTTIPMEELSGLFAKSKAKNILCILDCCFSGEAPARVLEDSPIARSGITHLESLAGKGRVLIAASREDEPSYELPGKNHGIFTGALIDVLLDSGEELAVNEAMDKVMDLVRAESQKAGVTQTPVSLGQIEGGFKLPAFTIGDIYSRMFPEVSGIRVTNDLHDLAQFSIPQAAIDAWAERFDGGLNELQMGAINDYRLLDNKSLLVVAPTSSGKTFIGELAAIRGIQVGRKSIFLLPYKALVNEKYDQFSSLYGDELGLNVIRCSGDYADNVNEFMRGKYDIAFLTYEMFLGLVTSNSSLMNVVGLVVIDEAHFITDESRGINVELLLTYLITLRERNIEPQIVALSAVIGSINDFDSWLGISKLVSTTRPVPLIEGVLDRNGTYQFKDPLTDEIKTEQLLSPYDIVQRKKKPSSQDVIVPLVQKLVSASSDEKLIVFRTSKGKTEGSAEYLAAALGLPAASSAIEKLPVNDLSTTSQRLRASLQGGTAFHNTNLNRQEREVVEKEFRRKDGGIRALSSTTTMAAGINTPASTVIIAEHEFAGPESRSFSVAEYKNMAGRAGRMGYKEDGRSILLASHSGEREFLFQRYVLGQLDPLQSSFHLEEIETWIMRLLAQVNGPVERDQVVRLLVNTYGGYLAVKANPDWSTEMVGRLQTSLSQLLTLGLIEDSNGLVSLTLLGRACGRSALSFNSMRILISVVNSLPQEISPRDLLAAAQVIPELDRQYIPMFKRGVSEGGWPGMVASRFGMAAVRVMQSNAADTFAYYSRSKKALVLDDWINGSPVEAIERAYTMNPFYSVSYGDITAIADGTRFFLGSASEIALLLRPSPSLTAESLTDLMKRLEVGIPQDSIDLLNLPIRLVRGEYLLLRNASLLTVEAVRGATPEQLEEILGETRTSELIAALQA